MKAFWSVAIIVVILIVSVVSCLLLYDPLTQWFSNTFNPEKISKFLEQTGPLAPLIFIGLQALQVILAPVPMQVFGIPGGYIFGVFWGTVYSLIGLTIGSFIAIWLARKFGRSLVVRFVEKDILDKFDHLVEKGGLLVFFLIFLLPALPDDAICFIAGLTKIPIALLVMVAILGRLPGLVWVTLFGAQLREGINGTMTIAILTVVVLVTGLGIIFRKQIESFFTRMRHHDDEQKKPSKQLNTEIDESDVT